MVKTLKRGQTVTVQKRDSNSWTVTVQLLTSDFDYLRGITGFSLKHRTCSLMSKLSNDSKLASIGVL